MVTCSGSLFKDLNFQVSEKSSIILPNKSFYDLTGTFSSLLSRWWEDRKTTEECGETINSIQFYKPVN